MILKTLVVGPFQCNCVVLGCEKTKEAVVVDPGDEAPRIIKAVQDHGLKVKYLLHTHAHFDHVGATAQVKKETQGKICLHQEDNFIYEQLPMQTRMFGFPSFETVPVEKFLEHEEELSFGSEKIRVIHTPGHSPGSVSFLLSGSQNYLLSGDTLFHRSIGRTDLWGGDTDLILTSIRERIFTLDGDLPVIPGHGPETLIGEEKRENPFFA
jgi:glyoxylase-like metal-dependent hydrolase (beta-lactamase superfamily II)